MPDYNQFSLTNSRAVPKLPGLPVQEIQKVLDVKMNLYQRGESLMDATNDALASGVALPGSQAALQELNAGVKARLSDFAKRGDYENLNRELFNTYKDYQRDLSPFLQEYQSYKKWEDELVKEKDLNPEAKQKYRQYALAAHQGVQRDPVTGAYQATFVPPPIVRDVDISKKVDGWLKDVVARKTGSETRLLSRDGMKYIESGGKTVVVTPQMLQDAMDHGMALDPEFKAYVQREQLFAGMGTYATPEERNAAIEGVGANLYKNMWGYGRKYLQHDVDKVYKESDSAAATAAALKGPEVGMMIGDTALLPIALRSATPQGVREEQATVNGSLSTVGSEIQHLQSLIKSGKNGDGTPLSAGDLNVLNSQLTQKQQEYNQVQGRKQQLDLVGANVRSAILNSADVQVYNKDIQALNNQLKKLGLGTQALKSGETIEPWEILNGNPDLVGGRVQFSTLDGRRITSGITADQWNKIQKQFGRANTPTGKGVLGWTPGLTGGGSATGTGSVRSTGPATALPGVVRAAIDRTRNAAFEDKKNFQYSSRQVVFNDQLSGTFSDLVAANPSLEIVDKNGSKVKDPSTVTQYKTKVTGVTFDGLHGSNEPVFTLQVDKGKKDGKTEYEYYTTRFPGSPVKELLIQKGLFSAKPDPALYEWARYQSAATSYGVSAQDISTLSIGEARPIPGTNLFMQVTGAADTRIPTRPYGTTEKHVIIGRRDVNGHIIPSDFQNGAEVMKAVFPVSQANTAIFNLPFIDQTDKIQAAGIKP